jgi:clan AA aspartic protease
MKENRGEGVGTFLHPVRLGRLDGSRWEDIDALVDTGSTYTWIPRPLLNRLGIPPTDFRRLQMADGRVIEREAGLALITVRNRTVATLCIFGDVESMPLLGAVSLEELGFAADPVQQRLVPVVGYALASA